jgi:hypothetical protein
MKKVKHDKHLNTSGDTWSWLSVRVWLGTLAEGSYAVLILVVHHVLLVLPFSSSF